jgi:hypothetical protein
MVDVIRRQLLARRDHVNTIVLNLPSVRRHALGDFQNEFSVASAVPDHVKTRLHLLATNFGW